MLALLLLSGCSAAGSKPAVEDLSLALAGMDGKDTVSFEGSAALLIAGKPVPESALYYGGKVQDHTRISLYSLLPDENRETRAAAEQGMKKLGESKAAAPASYTRLEKKTGSGSCINLLRLPGQVRQAGLLRLIPCSSWRSCISRISR